MGRNENISYIKSNPQIYLKSDRSGKGFICPVCGSGTGQNGTGITTKDKVHFTCWTGCFKSVDIIDIIGMEHGLSGFNEKYKKACELYGLDADEQNKSYRDRKAFDYVLNGFKIKYGKDSVNPRVTQEFKYYTHEKKYAFSSFRIDYETPTGHKDKKFFQWFVDANGFCKKLDNKIPAMFGDFEKIKPGAKVIVCEGEKDCITYKKQDKNAIVVTCGGSGRWKDNCNDFFRDCEVVVYQDNDKAGEKLPKSIIKGIGHIAKSIKVIIPYKEKSGGDVTDFFQNGGTLQQLEEMEQKAVPVQKQASMENTPNLNIGQDTGIDYKPFHLCNENGKITGINHNAIAEDIKAKHSLFVSGCFYESDRGHYKPDVTGAKIKDYIKQRIIPDMRKSQSINQIYNLLHDDFSIERNFSDTNLYPARWVPFNDCLLDPLTFEEIAYKDEFYCVNRLPHNWKDCKNATDGEETEKYLNFAFPDEQDREMSLSYDGLSCNRDTSFQKAMLYVGEGGSGKSVKLRILQAILGVENYSNVGLFDLGKRFMPGLLLGKLANICADLPIKALSDEASEALKLIVGEDMIFHETKGQNGFFFTPYCKMTFSMNMLPQVLDERNNAVFRRLLILRMDNVPKHPDTALFSKLEKELPYYIKLTMEALHRVYERGYILESENSKKEIEQIRRDSDTTEDFLDMCCTKKYGARVDRGELFTRYEKHCENEGRQALSKNAFNKAIRAKGYKQVKSCGYYYFEGISLEKSALNSPPTSKQSSLNGVEVDANGFIKVDEEALKDFPFT